MPRAAVRAAKGGHFQQTPQNPLVRFVQVGNRHLQQNAAGSKTPDHCGKKQTIQATAACHPL